ncbi:MAG: stage III sporulation protein AF [Clostridia bacterium]|nr:stage III sporulation protein AF [Clostridia bacterium]
MEAVRNIAASVSVAAVIIGAVFMLSPEGKMLRQIRFVAGLLMLVSIISPFLGARWDSISLPSEQGFTANGDEMIKNQAVYLSGALLSANQITYTKIEPFMDISEDGVISIYRIYVYGVDDIASAEAILSANFTECEVKAFNERG